MGPDSGELPSWPPVPPGGGTLPSWPPVPSGGQAPYFYSQPPTPTRRRRWRHAAAGGVLAVAAAAGVVVAAGSSSHHSLTLTLAPGAFVSAAAHQTIGQKTADVMLGGTVQLQGYTLPVHGSGAVDFSSHAMDLQMHLSASGHTVTEEMRFVDRNMYLSFSLDGTNGVLRQTGTASWVAMPIAQAVTGGGVGTDPVTTLSLLEKQGASVQTIGTKRIGGADCFGFSVTPTPAMMAEAQKAEEAALGLSPSEQARILGQVSMQPPTITMWIDQQKVLRQMTESLQMNMANSGSASGQIVFDFKDYGAAVHIAAPGASEVMPFNQFMRQAGGQAGQ